VVRHRPGLCCGWMAKRNPVREIIWSLSLGAIFALGLYLYIVESIPEPTPIAMTAPRAPTAADRRGDDARALATRWGAALAGGDLPTLHAALARPLRERLTVEALRDTIAKHPYLSSARAIVITRTNEQRAGNDPQAFSLRGTGLLTSGAGGVELTLHFVEEPDGLHIAGAVIAGTPAL